jgi:hypothetical protein
MLTGDFHVLEQWARSLDNLGSSSSLTDASRSLANEALKLTDQSFEQERSPTGARWAPKKRPDGRKIGQGKTGRLRDTYRLKSASRFGFAIGSDVEYKRWFHGGKKGQRPRPLTPGNRVPPRWDRAFDRVWHAHCLTKLRLK